MSHLYIYSPSSAVRDRAAFRRGIARLKALGHEVEVDPAALASHMRFAGDDATRLAAIHRAAASGADINLEDRQGNTALDITMGKAATGRFASTVEPNPVTAGVLLELGAKPGSAQRNGAAQP